MTTPARPTHIRRPPSREADPAHHGRVEAPSAARPGGGNAAGCRTGRSPRREAPGERSRAALPNARG
eukprot:8047603-Alexandrium_andersonii.AAC.1